MTNGFEPKLLKEDSSGQEILQQIRDEWGKVAGFAVCSAGPSGYSVVIQYRTIEQAQKAYRAIGSIDELLNHRPKFTPPPKPEQVLARGKATGRIEWLQRGTFSPEFWDVIDEATGQPIERSEK